MLVQLGAVHTQTSRFLILGTEMTADQCRKARELLKWTRQELASAANVTPWVIDAFEDGRDVSPSHVDAIRAALEAVGVGFPFELSHGRAASAGVTYQPRDRSETH
jgi:transcriptional regulator with XRE-family HTH domain